jgi:LysM repeat protein
MRAHRPLFTTAAVVGLAFLALLSTGRYTVQRGDTLKEIAAANHTTVAQLISLNGLTHPDLIHIGQQLVVATGGEASSSGPYTVRSGDTLGTIASRHGTSISKLVNLNELRNPNLIRIGQVLEIPAGGTSGGEGSSTSETPAGGATGHTVRAGETIGGIASRYGISQQQLITANGLTDEWVYIGQHLLLVPPAGSGPTGGGTSSYTVQAGDTLSSIALEHGTTTRAIQDRNGVRDPNTVRIGTTLEIPATGGGSTSMVCPVQGGVSFMNDWGFPRSGGRFHEGNDLFAPRGHPAVATVSGTVVQTTGRIGGHQVKLFGDDGVSYYYTHLDGFGAAGRVAAGDVVGYVGSTGNAAGGPTHVHFEIHPGGGAAINPYPRVAAAC